MSRREKFAGGHREHLVAQNSLAASQLSLLEFVEPASAEPVASKLHYLALLESPTVNDFQARQHLEVREERVSFGGGPIPLSALERDEVRDRWDQRIDRWSPRANREKQIRYKELKRLLPRGPFSKGVELACGKGDFALEMTEAAFYVLGVDISGVVVACAQQSFPQVRFQTADITALPQEWFEPFELIVWLDAIHCLAKNESAAVLRRVASAHDARPVALLISSCVTPLERERRNALERSDFAHRIHHSFETLHELLAHVRNFFPTAKGVPVELDFTLWRFSSISVARHVIGLGLKLLSRLGAYHVALRLVQWAMPYPWLFRLGEPFVAHFAVVVESPHTVSLPIMQQLAGWCLNRLLIAKRLPRRCLSRILSRCVRGWV